jgi:hypothetical protein
MKSKSKKHKIHRKSLRRNKKNKFTKKRNDNRFRGGELDNSVKQVITHTIQDRDVNFSKMLQVSCKNPDNCLALGQYDEKIKLFFDNFRNLNYIDNSLIKRIGNPSANGFIIELPFTKLNYTAYTVLKCATNARSDNLFYEYYVGKYFINKYLKQLPCFVETYDLYEFNSNTSYITIKSAANNDTLSSINFKSNMHRINTNERSFNLFNYSCLKNKLLCLLIQHFDKFYSFEDMINTKHDNIKYDIYNILYQAYYGLCTLGANYTHYDLHDGNVFLYKPFDNNVCILMRYHRNNQVFEFKSEYIVKIIDYGRNYFYNGKLSTERIMRNLCKIPDCKPNCGENFGYRVVKGSMNDPSFNFYWIDPTEPNVSHDLRFANSVKEILLKNTQIQTFEYKTNFGTPEDMTGDKDNVKSIFDLRDALEELITDFNPLKNEKKYANWKVAATMDIYDDGRDYEFVILPDKAI